ncbi:MAG: hypothetical protein LBR80_13230 [Deltaproteobacteria bacterium]|jgi:hypothetical protein|nr:hypothetical protein [Deltaproteobacteria bacterium]
MAYQQIFVTSLTERYPESVGGVKPVMSHGLLSQLIERELSGETARFLAEPMVKDREGRIEWVTPLEGDPVDIRTLAGAERDDADDALCLKAGELAQLGARLTGADSGEQRLAGRLISLLAMEAATAAAGVEGAARVFAVGGVPVMAGWGLSKAASPTAGGPSGHQLTERESNAVRRILSGERLRDMRPSVAVPAAPASAPMPPVTYAEPVFAAHAAPPVAAPGSLGWLKALLAALGVFLLALVVFLLLAPDFRRAAVAAAAPDARQDSGREGALQRELAGLKDRYGLLLAACRPETSAPTATAPPPIPDGQPMIPPPPPPPEPQPEPPAENAELRLPADGEDLGFLDGCWTSDAGLKSMPEGLPLTYTYCFSGGSGAARVTVEVFGYDGRINRTCETSATARLEGGTLSIRDRGARCAGGGGFTEAAVVCVSSDKGAADCVVQNRGGADTFETRFTYKGEG